MSRRVLLCDRTWQDRKFQKGFLIAKYPARPGSDDILLLAVTLDHDHERLKSLLRQHRSFIEEWGEGDA